MTTDGADTYACITESILIIFFMTKAENIQFSIIKIEINQILFSIMNLLYFLNVLLNFNQ